jgi:hypothetical protein
MNKGKREAVDMYLSKINRLSQHCEVVMVGRFNIDSVDFELVIKKDPFIDEVTPVVSDYFERMNARFFREIFNTSPIYNNTHTMFWAFNPTYAKRGEISAGMLQGFKDEIDSWTWTDKTGDLAEDERMLKAYAQDRKDLTKVLKLCEKGEYKKAYKLAWGLDTIVRELIPESVYSYIEEKGEQEGD